MIVQYTADCVPVARAEHSHTVPPVALGSVPLVPALCHCDDSHFVLPIWMLHWESSVSKRFSSPCYISFCLGIVLAPFYVPLSPLYASTLFSSFSIVMAVRLLPLLTAGCPSVPAQLPDWSWHVVLEILHKCRTDLGFRGR